MNPSQSPSIWFNDTTHYPNVMRQLEVDGLSVKYIGLGNSDVDAASVRTDHLIPEDCPFYFFEVKIIRKDHKGLIGNNKEIAFSDLLPRAGLSGKDVNLARLPGWDEHSFGYHGDDGCKFSGSGTGILYGSTFGENDVIGCYWKRAERVIRYTKNGVDLGIAFRDVNETTLYPSVGFRSENEEVTSPFE